MDENNALKNFEAIWQRVTEQKEKLLPDLPMSNPENKVRVCSVKPQTLSFAKRFLPQF